MDSLDLRHFLSAALSSALCSLMTSVSHGLGWVMRAGLEVRGQRLLEVASEEQSVSVALLIVSEENSL